MMTAKNKVGTKLGRRRREKGATVADDMETRENADLLAVLTEARLSLDREEAQFPASEWLKELREID